MPSLNSFIPGWRANAAPAYKPSTMARTMQSSIRHWLLSAPIKENQSENQGAFLTRRLSLPLKPHLEVGRPSQPVTNNACALVLRSIKPSEHEYEPRNTRSIC